MGAHQSRGRIARTLILFCICLSLSSCLSAPQLFNQKTPQQSSPVTTTQATATSQPAAGMTPIASPVLVPGHQATSTPGAKHGKPTQPGSRGNGNGNPPGGIQPNPNSSAHPVLAFYYMWYNTSTWSLNTMSDLPTIHYNSSDDTTIDRQVNWAASAGITGFISSWWGPGDQTDKNFVKLLAHSASLESRTHYHFASSIYFECDAPKLQGSANIVNGLSYLIAHYANDPHFFHWQGKPVFFFWDPLGGGRTLSEWASIRSQVDPNDQTIWSAEGVDTSMLSVFDGIHLFSGGYWGLQSNDMTAVDQGFRNKVDAYNSANGTHKIWAAGIIPGYDDTRVPGRTGTYIVPRDNGTTYSTSWSAAIASHPDWITITSFNEWFEGSMIEPSMTYGNEYLTLTQQYTQQW